MCTLVMKWRSIASVISKSAITPSLSGRTAILASRIADYAQAGQVIVSQAVVDASTESPVAFRTVGPVELKGVAGAMELYAASRAG